MSPNQTWRGWAGRSARRIGTWVSLLVLAIGMLVGPARASATAVSAGSFSPVSPTRVLDTRNGTGGVRGPIGPRQHVAVKVTGVAGVPSSGVAAVVLNVTVTNPTAAGYLSAYPDGSPLPSVSNLNFTTGQTIPNAVIVPVGSTGNVDLFNGSWAGSVQLIADISGYYLSGRPTAAGAYGAVAPTRVLDSRNGVGGIRGPIGARRAIRVRVTGLAGVPSAHVAAVVLNVTVTNPTAAGYVTAYPDGSPLPSVSNLNFTTGQTIANAVTVPVINGYVDLFNGSWAGSTQLIADISGYYVAGAATATGALDVVTPTRVLDTRNGTGGVRGPIGPRQHVAVKVTGVAGVPSSGVSAVVLNVTVTNPTAAGYLSAYPDGSPLPSVSNLNFTTGQTIPNAVIVPVGSTGNVDLFNGSWAGSVQLIADISGYYLSPPGRPVPASPGDSKNCSDFATWQAAQGWYEDYYPYYGDVAGLDGDNNGIACQDLPGAP